LFPLLFKRVIVYFDRLLCGFDDIIAYALLVVNIFLEKYSRATRHFKRFAPFARIINTGFYFYREDLI
jgi:hypothetical protein